MKTLVLALTGLLALGSAGCVADGGVGYNYSSHRLAPYGYYRGYYGGYGSGIGGFHDSGFGRSRFGDFGGHLRNRGVYGGHFRR